MDGVMPRHRSFKLDKFIRVTDGALLNQYFVKNEIPVPEGTDLGNKDHFDKFWNGLTEEDQAYFESDLQRINDIADKTRDFLQVAVKQFNIAINNDAKNPDSPETIAMRVFLHSEEAFDLAHDRYLCVIYAEKLSHHKFKTGSADFAEAKFDAFEKEIVDFLKDNSKGEHYDVRRYESDGKYYVLIARGDFVKTHFVFKNGKIDIDCYRPAKEDVLVFDRKNSVLSIKLGTRDADEEKKYLEVFGKQFMGVDVSDINAVISGLVDLDPIKNGTFKYDGNEHIEAVRLTEVKVRQGGKRGGTWVSIGSGDVRDVFSRYKLQADFTNFIAVKLKFYVKRKDKKSKPIQIEIRPPLKTGIPEKEGKAVIEEYLHENGVLLLK